MHALHHVVVGHEKVLCNGVLGPSTALLTYIGVPYDKAIALEWLAVDHKRAYEPALGAIGEDRLRAFAYRRVSFAVHKFFVINRTTCGANYTVFLCSVVAL